jgi:hypothetical protein
MLKISFSLYPLRVLCDFSKNKTKHINIFLNVNFSYCIKSGFKSYNNYKQKAIKEISANKCFKVKIMAKINNTNNINKEKNNEIKENNEIEEIKEIKENNEIGEIKEIKEWSFYACYTQSEYLRNYVK